MAKRHIKRFSTSLIIRELQISITVRYHFSLVRMAIINKSTNNKCWRWCGEKGTLLHCWWECKWIQPLWRTDELIKKMWYIYTMAYYSAIKRNEIGSFVEMWMDLESVIKGEVCQKGKNKYRILMHICGI